MWPLMFLIYILTTTADYAAVRMYADDTYMTFTDCSIPELQHDMNIDLRFLQNWLIANRLKPRPNDRNMPMLGATYRNNVGRNMLRPTMLRHVALACCDRLAGA